MYTEICNLKKKPCYQCEVLLRVTSLWNYWYCFTVYVIFGFSCRLSVVLTVRIFLKQLTKDSIPSLMRYLCKTFLSCDDAMVSFLNWKDQFSYCYYLRIGRLLPLVQIQDFRGGSSFRMPKASSSIIFLKLRSSEMIFRHSGAKSACYNVSLF